MARIAFFALSQSFDLDQIGGTDSIVRRLARRLAERGDDVGLVQYGCPAPVGARRDDGIEVLKRPTFGEALEALAAQYDHVVTIYLKPRDRIAYARFRRSHGRRLTFHHVYLGWHERALKRRLLFAEARLAPFNGYLFCVSPRIHRHVSRWASRAELLLPPVPEGYFCQPGDKCDDNKVRVTYAGRVDAGKGTLEAVEVMRRLAGRPDVEARICGFAWSHKPQTVRLHESLLNDPAVAYEAVEYRGWSVDLENAFMRRLRETDVLLLPYRKLSSTVDTPLLLLEGMASLCAVIAPRLGDLHDLYGPSPFNLSGGWSTEAVVGLIERARPHLAAERQRLAQRSRALSFDTESVAARFRSALLGRGNDRL